MTTSKKLITADDLLALPDDGRRYELVRGELVEMAPGSDEHGFAGSELSWRLGAFVSQHRLGTSRIAETGFWIERNPDTIRAPDYAFISYDRMPNRPSHRGYAQVVPDLVVEVASPNDRQPEIDAKTQMWLDAGVGLVLNVYPETQTVYTRHDDGSVRRFGPDDILTCDPVLTGFTCPVADIFAF